MRLEEALWLERLDVHLEPAIGAKYGYLHIRDGKFRNARRNLSLTERVRRMLASRANEATTPSGWPASSFQDHLALDKTLSKLSRDFVVHSLRHATLTRLGEAGVDAFMMMRIAGHSSITDWQRYVHPTPEAVKRAFERLEAANDTEMQKVGIPAVSADAGKAATILN